MPIAYTGPLSNWQNIKRRAFWLLTPITTVLFVVNATVLAITEFLDQCFHAFERWSFDDYKNFKDYEQAMRNKQ